jgi:hypothetical protein
MKMKQGSASLSVCPLLFSFMKTVEVEELVMIKSVPFPEGERFRQIIVVGPPGSGKTTMVAKLGGWSEEGYLDLAQKAWWRNRVLSFRPREVHLGLPFVGHEESHAVFDPEWLESPTGIDFDQIQIPPEGKNLLKSNWRGKFLFDFQLPPPELIYRMRKKRTREGTHPVDLNFTLKQVKRQVEVFTELAAYFHRQGINVIIRNEFQGTPKRFME